MVVDISAKCGEESSARLMNDLVIKIMEDEEPLVRLRIIRKIHILADEIPRFLCLFLSLLRVHFMIVFFHLQPLYETNPILTDSLFGQKLANSERVDTFNAISIKVKDFNTYKDNVYTYLTLFYIRHMGQEFFTENFLTGFLLTLKDEVEEVRMAASAILPLLVSASTPLWIQEKIFPSVRALSAESYIKRISFLNSLKSLLEAELPDSFQTEVL